MLDKSGNGKQRVHDLEIFIDTVKVSGEGAQGCRANAQLRNNPEQLSEDLLRWDDVHLFDESKAGR